MSFIQAQPSETDNKLARAFVHPEKTVRDDTLKTLQSYIGSLKSMNEMEMLKLWKALYYCMWLADKKPIQEELAHSLINLLDKLKTKAMKLLYMKTFYIIMFKEWPHLDHNRMNKFYFLMRLMFRKIVSIAFQGALPDFIPDIQQLLTQEILTKLPNGPRNHLVDIYIDEIYTSTQGKCDTNFFFALYQPLLSQLSSQGDENHFMDRIVSKFGDSYLDKYALENSQQNGEEDGEAAAAVFSSVDTKQLQLTIFRLASSPETNDRYRRRLYRLHKAISEKTKVDFVVDPAAAMTATTTTGSSSNSMISSAASQQVESTTATVQDTTETATAAAALSKKQKKAVKKALKRKLEQAKEEEEQVQEGEEEVEEEEEDDDAAKASKQQEKKKKHKKNKKSKNT